MRRRAAAAPILLGAVWILALWGRLLSPAVALANRDVPGFHVPLRLCLMRLAAMGFPTWNPWITGGQPVLSDPNYAAWYPLTWIAWGVGPLYSLNLLTLLHAGIAFSGAWVLARRLGCGRAAAALAAIGWSGCGAYASLLSAFTMFTSMAWFPWALAGAVKAVAVDERRSWLPAAVGAGCAWGIQVLNGDPICEVMTGFALILLAAVSPWRRSGRLLVTLGFAGALAAVQLLPAAGRLSETPRGAGLRVERAQDWSLPPLRLGELLVPRLLGDATRVQEGLYFGSGLDQRPNPYVGSLYPGLLLAVAGLGALCAGRRALPRIPLRGLWAGGLALGVFLALGRHNPLHQALLTAIPPLAAQRYPEKYAVLAVACLVFAGALGWQRLLAAAPGEPQRRAATPALALALASCVLAAVTLVALTVRPEAVLAMLSATNGGLHAAPEVILAALRQEARTSLAIALAASALLFAVRQGRYAGRTLSCLALGLVGVDLLHQGQRFAITVAADEYRTAPAWRAGVPTGARIYADPSVLLQMPIHPGSVRPELAELRFHLAHALPYTPILWGLPYAISIDYDLSGSHWTQLAIGALERDETMPPALVWRAAGAWGATTIVHGKTPDAWARERAADPAAAPVELYANPAYLPRLRFVPHLTLHGSYREAMAAARAESYDLARSEHAWQGGGGAPQAISYAGDGRLLAVADSGGRLTARYRASGPALMVVATTFDSGWHATVDGRPVSIRPTVLCQQAIGLPGGEHTLRLVYRQPWLPLGAAITAAAVLAALAVLVWSRAADPGRAPAALHGQSAPA